MSFFCFRKMMSMSLVVVFMITTTITPGFAQQLGPALSSTGFVTFEPPVLKALTIHPENPLILEFLIDRGKEAIGQEQFNAESLKLVKYFLTALTIPEKESWVNLSPKEKDRIVPDTLGQTDMGRVMLEQDYQLKQLAASLTNPDTELGKKYWQAMSGVEGKEHAGDLFGKVWITPESATVAEKDGLAYITKSHLKVMMQEEAGASSNEQNVFCQWILPQLEKDVNESQTFGPTRQIYQSVILAAWYKQALKESLLGKIYVDRAKLAGVETDEKDFKEKVYSQYLEALKKGAYNIIKDEEDARSGEVVPRKYFSGGQNFNIAGKMRSLTGSAAVVAIADDVREIPSGRVQAAKYYLKETPLDNQKDASSSIVSFENYDEVYEIAGHLFEEWDRDLKFKKLKAVVLGSAKLKEIARKLFAHTLALARVGLEGLPPQTQSGVELITQQILSDLKNITIPDYKFNRLTPQKKLEYILTQFLGFQEQKAAGMVAFVNPKASEELTGVIKEKATIAFLVEKWKLGANFPKARNYSIDLNATDKITSLVFGKGKALRNIPLSSRKSVDIDFGDANQPKHTLRFYFETNQVGVTLWGPHADQMTQRQWTVPYGRPFRVIAREQDSLTPKLQGIPQVVLIHYPRGELSEGFSGLETIIQIEQPNHLGRTNYELSVQNIGRPINLNVSVDTASAALITQRDGEPPQEDVGTRLASSALEEKETAANEVFEDFYRSGKFDKLKSTVESSGEAGQALLAAVRVLTIKILSGENNRNPTERQILNLLAIDKDLNSRMTGLQFSDAMESQAGLFNQLSIEKKVNYLLTKFLGFKFSEGDLTNNGRYVYRELTTAYQTTLSARRSAQVDSAFTRRFRALPKESSGGKAELKDIQLKQGEELQEAEIKAGALTLRLGKYALEFSANAATITAKLKGPRVEDFSQQTWSLRTGRKGDLRKRIAILTGSQEANATTQGIVLRPKTGVARSTDELGLPSVYNLMLTLNWEEVSRRVRGGGIADQFTLSIFNQGAPVQLTYSEIKKASTPFVDDQIDLKVPDYAYWEQRPILQAAVEEVFGVKILLEGIIVLNPRAKVDFFKLAKILQSDQGETLQLQARVVNLVTKRFFDQGQVFSREERQGLQDHLASFVQTLDELFEEHPIEGTHYLLDQALPGRVMRSYVLKFAKDLFLQKISIGMIKSLVLLVPREGEDPSQFMNALQSIYQSPQQVQLENLIDFISGVSEQSRDVVVIFLSELAEFMEQIQRSYEMAKQEHLLNAAANQGQAVKALAGILVASPNLDAMMSELERVFPSSKNISEEQLAQFYEFVSKMELNKDPDIEPLLEEVFAQFDIGVDMEKAYLANAAVVVFGLFLDLQRKQENFYRFALQEGLGLASSGIDESVNEEFFNDVLLPKVSFEYRNQEALRIVARVLFLRLMKSSKKDDLTRKDVELLLKPKNFARAIHALQLTAGKQSDMFNRWKSPTSKALYIMENVLGYVRTTIKDDVDKPYDVWNWSGYGKYVVFVETLQALVPRGMRQTPLPLTVVAQNGYVFGQALRKQFVVLVDENNGLKFAITQRNQNLFLHVRSFGKTIEPINRVVRVYKGIAIRGNHYAMSESPLKVITLKNVNGNSMDNVDFVVDVEKVAIPENASADKLAYEVRLLNFGEQPLQLAFAMPQWSEHQVASSQLNLERILQKTTVIQRESVAGELFEQWFADESRFTELKKAMEMQTDKFKKRELKELAKELFKKLLSAKGSRRNPIANQVKRLVTYYNSAVLENPFRLYSYNLPDDLKTQEKYLDLDPTGKVLYFMTNFFGYVVEAPKGQGQPRYVNREFYQAMDESLVAWDQKGRKASSVILMPPEFSLAEQVERRAPNDPILKVGDRYFSALTEKREVDLASSRKFVATTVGRALQVYLADDYQLNIKDNEDGRMRVEVLQNGKGATHYFWSPQRSLRVTNRKEFSTAQSVLMLEPSGGENIDFTIEFLSAPISIPSVELSSLHLENQGSDITVEYDGWKDGVLLEIEKTYLDVKMAELRRQFAEDPIQKENLDALESLLRYVMPMGIVISDENLGKIVKDHADLSRQLKGVLQVWPRGMLYYQGLAYKAAVLLEQFFGYERVKDRGYLKLEDSQWKAFIQDRDILSEKLQRTGPGAVSPTLIKTEQAVAGKGEVKVVVALNDSVVVKIDTKYYLKISMPHATASGISKTLAHLMFGKGVAKSFLDARAVLVENKLFHVVTFDQKNVEESQLVLQQSSILDNGEPVMLRDQLNFTFQFETHNGKYHVTIKNLSSEPLEVGLQKEASSTVEEQSDNVVGGPASPVGGIDFDTSKLNLQIKRDGHGVPLPLPQQDWEHININGLYPVMINIQPVNLHALPILSGMSLEPVERISSMF